MNIVIVAFGVILLLALIGVLISKNLLKLKLNKVRGLITKLDSQNKYHLLVPSTDIIEASATIKDGRKLLIISKGALKFFTIPEFAFVLGHEIAHHQLGHTGMLNLYATMAGGGIMEAIRPKGFMESIGFSSMRNEPFWWKIISKGVEVFTYQAYQRDEYAADRRGVELMVKIGFDKSHAKSALAKLKHLDPDKSGLEKIIHKYFGQRVHPFLSDRIARI